MSKRSTATRLRSRNEKGLALLDVLIGMSLFALIAIIAIAAIGQYRMRAYQSATQSDARQLGVALQAAFADNQTFPADLTALNAFIADANSGVKLTKHNKVADYKSDGQEFGFCLVHRNGSNTTDAWTLYESKAGGISATDRGVTGSWFVHVDGGDHVDCSAT